MKNTCCVPYCDSRRSSVKLHRFPKTEIGLKWLKYINCAKLKELSSGELHKFCVCHRHFEKRFVTKSFRLQVTAYPTLFTYQEIKTGQPSQPDHDAERRNVLLDHDYTQTRKRKHEDHTYSKTYQIENIKLTQDYNLPSTSNFPKIEDQNCKIEQPHQLDYYLPSTSKLSKIVNQPQNIEHQHLSDYDLPSTSKLSEIVNQPQNVELQHLSGESPSTRTTKINEKCMTDNDKAIGQCTNVVTPKKKRFVVRKNKLSPTCYKILKEYKKAKKQLNFATRVQRAAKFSKKGNFEKITKRLNPLAKKILWMQISQCTKQIKGRRFTDEEKIIALAIMKQSPKSYKFLRRIFILPTVRTINKMISKLQVESGINPQIFHAIKTEVNNWEESKKYCSLMFDEVALEPGVVYNKHKDNICGFVELENKTSNFADHALVFMLRGALHKWQQPICFYLCEGATSAQALKNILKSVLTEIMKTGLIPVALLSDQGTAFQSAIKKLQEDTRRHQILAKQHVDDIIEIDGAKINVLYDPPHLIKGIRNNFLVKDIKYDGKISRWNDIIDVYLTDCKHTEMRLLHKLNDEHVIPEKVKKMKVRNCTRVLSKTVASALNYTAQFSHYVDGREVSKSLQNTAETVSFLDDLFDSCNGATLSLKHGKPLRQAVSEKSVHEKFWRNAITKLEKMRFINRDGKETMVPSQKNFITTLRSLIRLWQLFKGKGYKNMRPRFF